MSNLRKFTRVVLLAIAAYFLLEAGVGLIQTIPLLCSPGAPWELYWPGAAVTVAVTVIFAAAILYAVVYRVDGIVERVIGGEEVLPTKGCWLTAGFRLVCVAAGILFIYSGCVQIVGAVSAAAVVFQEASDYARVLAISQAVAGAAQLGFGAYLWYGAPGFVRWQVRKTIEQCREMEHEGE